MNSILVDQVKCLFLKIQSDKAFRESIFSENSLEKRFKIIQKAGIKCTIEDLCEYRKLFNINSITPIKVGGYCPEYEAHGTCNI